MSTLSRDLRRDLERKVRQARRVAEDGSRKALEHLSVCHHEPRGHLTGEQRKLRNRLRARARQLGDPLSVKGAQATGRLVEQCAYEQWHRILFARYLAENHLLIHPPSGQAISLEECRELAAGEGKNWLTLASEYAVRMLSQVFRADDAVLEVTLPPESRQELEQLLADLPTEVFTSSDSLGWTYQFWQAERKDAINASEVKIGAEELGPVTQLFTEDYMVEFLLHNTIGAWWAGKQGVISADTEEAARAQVSLPAWNGLPALNWENLRFLRNEDGTWRPAAGAFEGWPRATSEVTMLDPCMGSGHFLVFALPIMARLRAQEEGLTAADAVVAVLRDNLHGLELDERCTQIAAFNLALGAWRISGYQELPALQLACSGLSISAGEQEWVALAAGDTRLATAMKRLHQLFAQAPLLGSLINPRADGLDLLDASFPEVAPLLDQAVARSVDDAEKLERAVAAFGLAKAATLLAGTFVLVATNVPFLGREKHPPPLRAHIDSHYPAARADLACVMLTRILQMSPLGGAVAVVSPQYWLFLGRYKAFRRKLLETRDFCLVAKLGSRAFETISGEVVTASLGILSPGHSGANELVHIDCGEERSVSSKRACLQTSTLCVADQADQLANPDSVIGYTREGTSTGDQLLDFAYSYQGLATSDNSQFILGFWELPSLNNGWEPFQMAPRVTGSLDGCSWALHWEQGAGRYYAHTRALKDAGRLGGWRSGEEAWGQKGLAVNRMGGLPTCLYTGAMFDCNVAVVVPRDEAHLGWIAAYLHDGEFERQVRRLNQKPSVTNLTLVKVPAHRSEWEERAFDSARLRLSSSDPRQWVFAGSVQGAEQPLQVAVARLVGYVWPRQTGSSFPDCPTLESDGLEGHSDADGIVCLPALQREQSATARLRALLNAAFGNEWNSGKERELLAQVGATSETLEEWLLDEFSDQHNDLFHQRPFVWQIWDGVRGGFSALVNYHKLAAPNGGGRRTLEKLAHTYLGDWITRQRADVVARVDGAELKLAAAEHLKRELEQIVVGEPPCDIFARWKPLAEQSIGWDPDINDGVRINIRPFMVSRPYKVKGKSACILRATPNIKWGPKPDRGKEPERSKAEYPWFWGWDESTQDFMGGSRFDGKRWNDLHYSNEVKQAARDAAAGRSGSKAK